MPRRWLVILAAVFGPGCLGNRPSTFNAPATHIAARPVGHHWMPSGGALQMGMNSLRSEELPPGFREIRIQVVCELCTPDYLFRLRTGPGRKLTGELYLLQAHFTRRAGDTAGAQIDREYDARAAQQRADLRCSRPIRSADDRTDGCKIGLRIDWGGVLEMLDRSAVLRAVADTGYNPNPPGGLSGCGDLGSKTLTVEVLDGPRYGTAMFWCLEARGPPGAEHDRAASVRAALLAQTRTPGA